VIHYGTRTLGIPYVVLIILYTYVRGPFACILIHDQKESGLGSSRTAYGQLPHLLQDGFDLSIQLTRSVVVPYGIVEVLLNVTKFLVSLFSELALYADHGLERGIEVGHAQAEELGKFDDELVVENVKDFFGFVMFLLSSWKFGRVVTGFGESFV